MTTNTTVLVLPVATIVTLFSIIGLSQINTGQVYIISLIALTIILQVFMVFKVKKKSDHLMESAEPTANQTLEISP